LPRSPRPAFPTAPSRSPRVCTARRCRRA
jgi:hypothetical protein